MGGSGCGKTTPASAYPAASFGLPRRSAGCRQGCSTICTKSDLYVLRRRMGMLFQFGALFFRYVGVRQRGVS